MLRYIQLSFCTFVLALGGCASTTTVQLNPAPQAPVCEISKVALILWRTQWRADQKDVPDREAAATDGLGEFFKKSACFKSTSLQRVPNDTRESAEAMVAKATTRFEKVVLIVVRELGPTVKLGASLALIEGETQVDLEVLEYTSAQVAPRAFTVQWRSGGAGVIKGVATLPLDIQAALAAGLQPSLR